MNINNRFAHCVSVNEAKELLRLLLLSDIDEDEQVFVNEEYRLYLEFESRSKEQSFRLAEIDDKREHDYHKNIDYNDISFDWNDYPQGMSLDDFARVGQINLDDT